MLTIGAGIGYFVMGEGGSRRNFDIDFTGGNMIHVSFDEAKTREEVETTISTVYAQDAEAYSLLNPINVTLQPYYSELGSDATGTRQFVFKMRDDEAVDIEKTRGALVDERAQVIRQIIRLREVQERRETDPELRAAEAELERLNIAIAPEQEKLNERIYVAKQQLLQAFAGDLPAAGSEITKSRYEGTDFSMQLATSWPTG